MPRPATASGWIKRGPSGIIGTNKPDSIETVKNLLADLPGLTPCAKPSSGAMMSLLSERGVRVVAYDDWQKIDAAVRNAKAFLAIQKEFGSFDAFVWRFVGGKPKHNAWKFMKRIPANTKESDALSRELKRRGFGFVGSTICYAYMQAAGLVNDHLVDCFRYKPIQRMARSRQG